MRLSRDKRNKNTLFAVVIFCMSIVISLSDAYAGNIYIIYLKNGKNLKCLSVVRQQSTVVCDADGGLEMSIDKSAVTNIITAQGHLTKQSAQSRISGVATEQQNIPRGSTKDPRCAEILDELKKLTPKNSKTFGSLIVNGAQSRALTNEYELRCMTANQREGRQLTRDTRKINRNLNQIKQKQQEIQNAQRGIGY